MNCPNCRHENASTTRFCTSCGAVLVESTPQGGRRRVLRPWGLRGSAPPTESPAMPELVQARLAEQRGAAPRRRRVDVMLVCGFAFVAAAGVVAYPFSAGDDSPSASRVRDGAAPQIDVVAVPAMSTVRETQLAAPALIDAPALTPPVERPAPRAVTPAADPAQQRPSPPGAPVEVTEPSLKPPEPVAVAPAAERVPSVAAVVDRWAPLREALHGCGSADGLLQRAMCEQRARLMHCDGQWGNVALCPAGRTEYGQ